MSAWLVVTGILFVAFVLSGVRCAVGDVASRTVGLALAAVTAVLLFLALGRLLDQAMFTIVATVTGVGGFITNLAFARYFEDRL